MSWPRVRPTSRPTPKAQSCARREEWPWRCRRRPRESRPGQRPAMFGLWPWRGGSFDYPDLVRCRDRWGSRPLDPAEHGVQARGVSNAARAAFLWLDGCACNPGALVAFCRQAESVSIAERAAGALSLVRGGFIAGVSLGCPNAAAIVRPRWGPPTRPTRPTRRPPARRPESRSVRPRLWR